MNLSLVPPNSPLHHWLKLGRFMEAPYSYLTAVCLSGFSALLRRNATLDIDETGIVMPNLSIVLIGRSGIGKDTAINMGKRRILGEYMPGHKLNGVTKEGLAANLFQIHTRHGEDPTCGYILANEMKAMFGAKDYEAGMVEFLTDILTDGQPEYANATKHKPFIIPNPTVVLQAGSTKEWFHKLPEGALAGGFIPRMLVIVEDEPRAQVALPLAEMDFEDRQQKQEAGEAFKRGLESALDKFQRPRQMSFDVDAQPIYTNWYHNRYKLCGKMAQDYAHRARGLCAKIAIISAALRGKTIIDLADVNFAMGFMAYCIARMEVAILPPTEEGRCISMIKGLLPATYNEVVIELRPKFRQRAVHEAFEVLKVTGEVKPGADGKWVLA